MFSPPDPHAHGEPITTSATAKFVSDVVSVAVPIAASIADWLNVINSGLATLAALGGLYLLILNIKRARRLDREDGDMQRVREYKEGKA